MALGAHAGALARHRAAATAASLARAARDRRAAVAGLPPRARSRRTSATPLDPALAIAWVLGAACAIGRRVAGEVPSPRRAHPRGWRGSRHVPHVRVVLGARSRADATAGRDRHDGADAARAALAAEARAAPVELGGRARGAAAQAARSGDRVGAGGGLAALAYAAMTRPLHETISGFFVDARLPGGRRHQRRQRHPRRFPRLRYAGRDHRARCGRRRGVFAAAPIPAGARKHRAAAAAARAKRAYGCRRPARARGAHARHVRGDRGLRALPAVPRTQPSGRRIRCGHRARGRVHPAVHGRRHALGRGADRAPARAADGYRARDRRGDRRRRVAVRASVPHVARRAPRAAARSASCISRARSCSTSACSCSSSARPRCS